MLCETYSVTSTANRFRCPNLTSPADFTLVEFTNFLFALQPRVFRMAALAGSAGASQVLPSELYGVGLGLKRLADGTLMVNK